MATPQFHPLRIREVRPETADAVSVAFEVPAELRDQYRFTQGQFVTLKTHIDGEETRRSYSICVGVTDYDRDGELRIGIKRVRGGRFSNFAFDTLKPGHMIDVMTPDGRFFTHLNADHGKQYVAFSGGSGITPVLAIVKTTLELEPRSTFTLIYGNRSVDAIMFAEELEDLKNRYLQRLNLMFVFSRERQDIDLYNGRIDQDKCQQLFSRWLDVQQLEAAFICGPQAMTETVRDSLKAAGMPAERIHFELFHAGSDGHKRQARETASALDARHSRVTVISDGRALAFDLPRNSQSILDAGNAQGAELPYSCKAGVCSTCKCKVIEGEVEMDSNHALEDYEVAAGYVLSCQSFPLSDKVVLDFDQL